MHANEINPNDSQTMLSGDLNPLPDRTGTYMRSPGPDDSFGLKKLYPTNLQ
jgi:hypothetical protein